MRFLVPKGEVPPMRYPEWRVATSGLHGAMRLAPACRASSLVETLRSPCMRTMSGSPLSSSITSVLITWCSGTPIEEDEWPVPPCSTYSNSCSVYATFAFCSTAVAGVLAMSEEGAQQEARPGKDQQEADGTAQLLVAEPHVDALAHLEADPGEGREDRGADEDR